MHDRQQRKAAATKWALIVANVIFGLVLVGYGLHALQQTAGTYLFGESTTARVQHCIPPSNSKSSYRCSGTWQLADGQRGEGVVERAGATDEGETVTVHATTTNAVTGDGKAILTDSAWGIAVAGLGLFFLTAGPWKVARLFNSRTHAPRDRHPQPDPN